MKNIRWKASPGTRDLPDIYTATAVKRFTTERYRRLFPTTHAAPPSGHNHPDIPLYAKLMIRHTTVADTPVMIIQQPWMNEPRTYLVAETKLQEEPNNPSQEGAKKR